MLTVLEVLAVIAVLFGAAAVATREGPILGEAHRDRPDVGLPPGPLQPEDVAQLRFGLALRGYRMREVDEVLDRFAAELTARDAQIAALLALGDAQLGALLRDDAARAAAVAAAVAQQEATPAGYVEPAGYGEVAAYVEPAGYVEVAAAEPSMDGEPFALHEPVEGAAVAAPRGEPEPAVDPDQTVAADPASRPGLAVDADRAADPDPAAHPEAAEPAAPLGAPGVGVAGSSSVVGP